MNGPDNRRQGFPPPPSSKVAWPWIAASKSSGSPAHRQTYPKISIITPNFNHGRYLEETIRSVLLQGYPNLEYIVIDGGSTDSSKEIIEKYAPFLSYWISESDRGHADALNKGFARTTGEILAWLNSSDLYFPGALATVAEVFSAFPQVEWLTSSRPGGCKTADDMKCIPASGFSKKFFFVGGYLGGSSYSTGWIQQESTFWRRSVWEKAGARIDESFPVAIDFELWSRFFKHSDLAVVEERLGCFRAHDDQFMKQRMGEYLRLGRECIGNAAPPRVFHLFLRAWRRLRLHHVLDWKWFVTKLYGEKVPVIYREHDGGWGLRMEVRA